MKKQWPERRVLIGGTRTFADYTLLAKKMDLYTLRFRAVEVLVGGIHRGADDLGFRWACECWWRVKVFHPDWNTHGKAAGPIRNTEMAQAAQAAVLFWDGKSPGTRDMIAKCRQYGVPTKIVRV